MSIRISQLKDYSASVYQDRHDTAVVSKYLDTDTIKENSKFYQTTLPHDIMLKKEDDYASYEQVESLYIE